MILALLILLAFMVIGIIETLLYWNHDKKGDISACSIMSVITFGIMAIALLLKGVLW